jgi:hypothetical protein
MKLPFGGPPAPVLVIVLSLLTGRAARAESSVAASVLASRDDQGFSLQRYRLGWWRETPTSGQHLTVHLHQYALEQEFAGVLPFQGLQPAMELGGHLERALWWAGAALGFEGQPDLRGATGELVVARAILFQAGTLTPRLEVGRQPLALSPLPLSLGVASTRLLSVLGWRGAGWMAEAGARADLWDAANLAGRVRNGALIRVEPNQVLTGYGFLLTRSDGWFDWGFSAKATRSSHNTLVPTQVQPAWQYSWYPASAPPFAWETALIVRAQARPSSTLSASLQLALPALSRETRQWESVRQSEWGTAPLEGKLQGSWFFLAATAVELEATVFAKPWRDWNLFGAGAYRQASLTLSLRQRI